MQCLARSRAATAPSSRGPARPGWSPDGFGLAVSRCTMAGAREAVGAQRVSNRTTTNGRPRPWHVNRRVENDSEEVHNRIGAEDDSPEPGRSEPGLPPLARQRFFSAGNVDRRLRGRLQQAAEVVCFAGRLDRFSRSTPVSACAAQSPSPACTRCPASPAPGEAFAGRAVAGVGRPAEHWRRAVCAECRHGARGVPGAGENRRLAGGVR